MNDQAASIVYAALPVQLHSRMSSGCSSSCEIISYFSLGHGNGRVPGRVPYMALWGNYRPPQIELIKEIMIILMKEIMII